MQLVGPTLLALWVLSTAAACAAPLTTMDVSPAGHGKGSSRAGPQPIAWRANQLAAPCALVCSHSPERQGLACTCHALDSIYYSHLEHSMRQQTARGGN